ncbi:MAG TPA: alpha/beta fold hydrolase [Magnetospirillum sp.]|jgi:pimeloyl-ACP methyl ester carboxylesterase|nr:alpha/beta fold hydrolase [Magnetospirillum sp.]
MKLAYDLFFNGKCCGTSWAAMRQCPDGTVKIDCYQRMERVDAIGMPAFKKRSSYRFTSTGGLVCGRMEDSFGGTKEFEIDGETLHVKDREAPLQGRTDLVIEANMAPLTALQLKHFLGNRPGTFRALLPETGALVPYSLELKDGRLVSSMGETIELADDGAISEVTYKVKEFKVVRSRRPLPKWTRNWVTSRPTYVPPADLLLEDHVLATPDKEVEATSVTPGTPIKPRAAAVFIGGTGAYSRHGFAGRIDLGYHQLLDDLARYGIASVRYEKFDRRAATLEEAEELLDFTTLGQDAERWLDWLNNQAWAAGLAKILIGHSLGGMVALDIATRRPDLAAVVLLNAPGRSLRAVTEAQHAWLMANLGLSGKSEEEMTALRKTFLAALETDQPWNDAIDGRLQPFKRKWRLYKSILDIDPAELAKRSSCPVVIVQAGKDIQVAASDAGRLAEAATSPGRRVTLIEPPDLDHLLKRATKEGIAAMTAYADRRRRIPKDLIRRIARSI